MTTLAAESGPFTGLTQLFLTIRKAPACRRDGALGARAGTFQPKASAHADRPPPFADETDLPSLRRGMQGADRRTPFRCRNCSERHITPPTGARACGSRCGARLLRVDISTDGRGKAWSARR